MSRTDLFSTQPINCRDYTTRLFPKFADEQTAQVLVALNAPPSRGLKRRCIARQLLRAKVGEQPKSAIENSDKNCGKQAHPTVIGNGKLGDDPKRVASCLRVKMSGQLLDLLCGEAIEKKMCGNDIRRVARNLFNSGGTSQRRRIEAYAGAQVSNFCGEAVGSAHALSATGKSGEHGRASIDGVNANCGTVRKQARGKATVAVAEDKRAGAIRELTKIVEPASLKSMAKARVLHPAIGPRKQIEVGGSIAICAAVARISVLAH